MGFLKHAWPLHQVHTNFHSSSYLVPLSVPRQHSTEENSPEPVLAGRCCSCRCRCYWELSILHGRYAVCPGFAATLFISIYKLWRDASCKQRGTFPTQPGQPVEGMRGCVAGDQSNSSAGAETDWPTCNSLLSNKVLAIRADDHIPSNLSKSTHARSSLLCRA